MKIVLENVIPMPLADFDLSQSLVWNRKFSLEKGSDYLINASSGKGKSTFVNILYGLRHDYAGQVTFDGRPLHQLTINDWSEIRTSQLANVFQTLDLFPTATVIENIFLKNRLTDRKSEQEIRELLAFLEIDHLTNQIAGNLSMGQQQRVAIIRALCQPFDWILLDEPFSHLDADNIQKAWQLIQTEARNQDANIVMTTLGDNFGINNAQTLML